MKRRLRSIVWGSKMRITEAAIAISINRTYPLVKDEKERYDYTRGIWKVDRGRAERIEIAPAVYGGEVVEVFEIRCGILLEQRLTNRSVTF